MKPTIKERILKERGLTEHRTAPRKHKRLRLSIEQSISVKSKTPLMRYLEQKYGRPIDELLMSGSLSVVAKRLGNEVDTTTLSKWIKRFKLRYSEDNLPNCEGCKHYGIACSVGICYVLVNQELWELVELKKKEVLNNGG